MRIFLGLLGIALSLVLLKYRERIGNMIGEAEWMQKIGGIYNVIILIALIIFFWSLAELTGTTNIFFAPLRMIIPGGRQMEIEGF
ncbi:hypothetical protein HYZ99_04635 [Candidatus Peregrinibacteria bacterium]|nr:hypothetical protein [Candidatus Peregrinibacteria bacterium]